MAAIQTVYQDIELSLTEHLVPPVVHVKQFDHGSRKVRCALYQNSLEFQIPANAILLYSGTRPDGRLFQYSTEGLDKDRISLSDNRVLITVTDFMTAVSGRYPVDLVMLDSGGDILGAFSFTLYVERASVKNRGVFAATLASVAEAVREGIFEIFITEDGYFGVRSDDGLNLGEGSYSDIVERLEEEMLETSINDGGYLVFKTNDLLGLVFRMDGEGRVIVEYGL